MIKRNPMAGALRLFGKRTVEDKRRKERTIRRRKYRIDPRRSGD